jgi:hypothetical protein
VATILTTWPVGSAGAATTGKGAYVWANQPSSASYTPSAAYAYDSAGGTITITRSGAGAYTVRFPNLGSVGGSGTVNVSTYGSTPAACRTGGWGPSGADLLVNVDCYSLSGSLMDSTFTATFASDTAEPPSLDYVWANNPNPGIGSSYTPASTYQFDSAGSAVTVTQIATGSYDVNLPGPVTVGGSVKVSVYNNPAINCQVVDWVAEAPGQVAEVDCFDASGVLADSAFDLTFLAGDSLLGVPKLFSGYVWANNASAASYTPAKPYQYSSANALNTISRSGVGVYTVTLPGLGRSVPTGDVQVTAYGSTDDFCQVGSWGTVTSNVLVTVRCFNPAGGPADSEFTLQYVSPPGNLTNVTWTAGASVPNPHLEGAAVAVGTDVYDISGGTADCTDGGGGAATDLVDVYHTTSNTFASAAKIPDARDEAPVAGVINGKIYVVGGTASCLGPTVAPVDVYTPGSNTWTTLSSASNYPSTLTSAETCGAAVGNNLYVFTAGGIGVLNTAASPPSWTVLSASPLFAPSSFCKADSVGTNNPTSSGAKIVITGPGNGSADANSKRVIDYFPASNTASLETETTDAFAEHSASFLYGVVVAAGGDFSTGGTGPSTQVQIVDPTHHTATTITSLPDPRDDAEGVATVGGTMYIVGGESTSTLTPAVLIGTPVLT